MNARRVAAAEGVILAALKTKQTAAGIAIALESACLLQSPETAGEIKRLRSELAEYEVLSTQQCPKGLHLDWLVDSESAHACPWCEIDRLRAERHSTNEALSKAAEALRVQRDRIAELEAEQAPKPCGRELSTGQPCPDHSRPAQQPAEESYDSLPRFSAREIARWQARQQEDPHESPLHHDYAIGRDLPEVPRA